MKYYNQSVILKNVKIIIKLYLISSLIFVIFAKKLSKFRQSIFQINLKYDSENSISYTLLLTSIAVCFIPQGIF